MKSTHVSFLIEFMLARVRAYVCMFVCVSVCVISLAVLGTLILTGLQIGVRTGKLFFFFSTKTYVVGTQKNRLNETVLLSTHNTC